MGPTKAIVKGQALYEAVSGKLIQDGFASPQALDEYVKHHYIAMPVLDNAGKPWPQAVQRMQSDSTVSSSARIPMPPQSGQLARWTF